MIERIHITALKSIRDLSVKCSKLNILTGTNSSGKSTFLQALLLFAQEKLSGELISLGEFREVRNYYMPTDDIKVEICESDKTQPSWIQFSEDKDADSYKKTQSSSHIKEWGLHYLSCHRTGVNDIYLKNMPVEDNFGIDGQYALAFLLKNESTPVCADLLVYHDEYTNSLFDQVNYWMKYIIDTNLIVNDLKKTNYMQVKYNNNPANRSSEALFCRPVNVGSGVSYLISIIITCLGAKEDSVIVIENPEIHLHPKAQSRLSEFLYFVSNSGRQLFVETHSDHIFNGLRAGVATGQMSMDHIAVNFFAMNDQYETLNNPIVFGDYGRITGTNKEMSLQDLFDQFEIDLDKMMGL
ncbi:MAG: AAA family ATPase [Eubacterium sp.]|nr:AAA family ATPase [Eubacterium sp.]